MRIGIGLPANIPGVPGSLLLEWAKRADEHGFSSLGLIDRLVYANYDPLIAFAAAAAVTQRIRLTTSVLLAPLRNTTLLAKAAASLDALSGGRLTLGLGIGGREDDFQGAEVDFKRRGKIFEQQLTTMQRIWSGEAISDTIGPIGPAPAQKGGPEVLIGGYSPAAIARVGRWGNGYIAGGGGPQAAKQSFPLVQAAWKAAGRQGKPRLVGCMYIAIGPNGAERGGAYIRDYYSFLGQRADMMAQSLPTSLQVIGDAIKAFEDVEADEVILWPTTTDLEQIDQLATLLR